MTKLVIRTYRKIEWHNVRPKGGVSLLDPGVRRDDG